MINQYSSYTTILNRIAVAPHITALYLVCDICSQLIQSWNGCAMQPLEVMFLENELTVIKYYYRFLVFNRDLYKVCVLKTQSFSTLLPELLILCFTLSSVR